MTLVYWRDLDMEMEQGTNLDINTMTNFDAIHNSLTNIFNTMQGSRRMMPMFALPIYRLLFEPVDKFTASKLAESTLDAIMRWEKRIEVEGFDIIADPDNHQYEVTLTYRILEDYSNEATQIFTTILRAA